METLRRPSLYFNLYIKYGYEDSITDGRGMCFHQSAGWLSSVGNQTEKEHCIGESVYQRCALLTSMPSECYRISDYLEWHKEQPAMLLHELAHSLHHHRRGECNSIIEQAYQSAMKSRKYENIRHINGHTCKHYACTNASEYFAECSEAYFRSSRRLSTSISYLMCSQH